MSLPVINRINIGTGVVNDLPVYYEFEYTSPEVSDQFQDQLNVLNDVYGMSFNDFNALTDVQKQAKADAIKDALNNLVNLAQDGIETITVPAGNGFDEVRKTFFLTKDMAAQLDTLIRTFKAVGAEDPFSNITVAEIIKWKDLSVISPSIGEALVQALGFPQIRSIQAMIELDYVATGNNLINNKLSALEEKLQVTQDVVNALTGLQQLRTSNVYIVNSGDYSFPVPLHMPQPPEYSGTTGSIEISFDAANSLMSYKRGVLHRAGDNESIAPPPGVDNGIWYVEYVPDTITAKGDDVLAQIIASRDNLIEQRQKIGELSPDLIGEPNSIYEQLTAVINDYTALLVNKQGVPVTMASTPQQRAEALYIFLTDRNRPQESTIFPTTGNISHWNGTSLIPNTFSTVGLVPPGGTAGDAQQHLTAALTASQASNDQQKEEVRRFLFVFEEFYKSAAAILQRITQILEKMAQNFSR